MSKNEKKVVVENATRPVRTVTFNEIGAATNYNPTTIRCWARKPIPGVAYNPEAINYDFINSQLAKVCDDVAAKLGGVLGRDILIVKYHGHAGGTAIVKLKPEQMVVGTTYLVISHVNRFHYTLMGKTKVGDEVVYIFQDVRHGEFKKTQDAYRVLSSKELSQSRWVIRELANSETSEEDDE